MRRGWNTAWLAAAMAATAWSRPVTLEPVSSFGTPDPAYTAFATDVALEGDNAVVTAGRVVPDPGGEPMLDQNFATAFVFLRTPTGWTVVRRLNEYRQDNFFPIPVAVAMRAATAVVQTVETEIWQLGPNGWEQQPSDFTRDGPGPHLSIDQGTVLSGDGTGAWNARVFEPGSDGTWRTRAVLQGKPRFAGSDDQFRGGPADISGAWAVVQQPDGPEDRVPETFVFHDFGGAEGWFTLPYGSMRPPAGASAFGPEVAINWPDVFVAGGNESGTYVYREQPTTGFQLATRIQALDSFMGSGPAGAFAHREGLLLQHAWSQDRGVNVVNVFRRRVNGTFEHVAVLAARNGESLGRSIAISGRRVLVGDNGNGLVYHFEIPASFAPPGVIQDAFNTGNGAEWIQGAGSRFFTTPRGVTRVFRQTNMLIPAIAVREASDFTSQAVEADVRPLVYGASGSGIGLVTRYQGPQNFFEAMLRNNGRVELRRMAGGGSRVLASAAFNAAPNRYYRLRLESVGTLHRVYVDGRLLVDADSSGPTHGRAALVTDRAQGEFDNVVVTPSPFTTIYANDFEAGAAGPWSFSGSGFWNLAPGTSTTWFQSSIAGDARASIGVPAHDQVVRARVRLDTFASPTGTQERWFGLMARHVDERNFYFLSLRSSNTLSLRKVVDGTVTTLRTTPFAVLPASWYQLRLDAVGNRLRGYVNGVLLLETTDASIFTGNAGPAMFKAAADYDDFSVYQP